MPIDLERSHELYNAGRQAMENDDHEEAARLFEESVRLGPHFKTLELLGECYLQINRPVDAIIPLAAAVGLGSKAFRAMYLLAEAHARTDQREVALELVVRALEMKPDFKRASELKERLRKEVPPLQGSTFD